MTQRKMNIAMASQDVRVLDNFMIAPFQQRRGTGDSGSLLLATSRSDSGEQYILKHEFCHNAANEYVFSKLAQAIGAKVPDTKLFIQNGLPEFSPLRSVYIVGSRRFDVKEAAPSLETMMAEAENWRDYFYHATLSLLACEDDPEPLLLSADGYIYRLDASEAFRMDQLLMVGAIRLKPDSPGWAYVEERLNRPFRDRWSQLESLSWLDFYRSKYGDMCIPLLLVPLRRFQQITDDYVDEFLRILGCFYPDCVCGYYRRFVREAQEMAAKVVASYG